MTTVAQEPRCVIYGLYCTCHPERGIRYVGQTVQGASVRLREHLKHSRAQGTLPVYRWIRKHEYHISYEILEEVADPLLLNDAETKWIREMRTFEDRNGLNCDAGGSANRGERNRAAGAKLSDEQVLEIWMRLMDGDLSTAIHRDFPEVSLPVIYSIKHGRSYFSVQKPLGPFRKPRSDQARPRGRKWSQERVEMMRERMSGESNPMHGKRPDFPPSWHEARRKASIGESNNGSKITEEDVIEIRERAGRGEIARSIAEDYPISVATIYSIVERRSWKHIR